MMVPVLSGFTVVPLGARFEFMPRRPTLAGAPGGRRVGVSSENGASFIYS
jgi:hypothetical protein